jgi:hypothetical protein
MIVVRLQGGLGNQMFQYALGRCLAQRQDRPLLLESSALSQSRATPRAYGLDAFTIGARAITFEELARTSRLTLTVTQYQRGFHPEVLEIPRGPTLILNGLWISERYFAEAAAVVRRELTFRSAEVTERVALIQSCVAVAVHIRRGDYLSSCGAQFGFLGLEYYRKAIALMAQTVREPHFFVFSDEIEWCRTHLQVGHPHSFMSYGGPADRQGQEDLRLMSLCRHFIIANSTFSWWGAWLGIAEDKIVVAPRRWYRDDPSFIRSADIVPSRWRSI